jgi:hypothetical protein
MSDGEIRERLENAAQPAFRQPFDPNADLARGRRRRRRNRAVRGTASCAVLAAAAVLAVPALPSGSGGSGDVASGGPVDTSGITYVEGRSVIHDGDREIDVSPRQIMSFAKTDEGFVFVTSDESDRAVYFTDGEGVRSIGRAVWESSVVSDDEGSYVAWVAPTRETIVYDTSRGAEVLRKEIGDGGAALPPRVADLDGDVVYVDDRGVGLAWDFETGDAVRSNGALVDVSNGYLVQTHWAAGSSYPTRVVVSRDPDAGQPRFPALEGRPADGQIDLSPSGRYLASVVDGPTVFDRVTQQEMTIPDLDGYVDYDLGYWIDDDRHVFRAYRSSDDPHSRSSELLVCSVSDGSCELAVESAGRWPLFSGMALV